MRLVIINGNAVTDRGYGPDITDTIPRFTGQPECFSRLQCQCDGVTLLMVFDQFFQAVSPVFPFATAVGEFHKKAAPFSGRILFFSVVCQDGSHTFTGAELAGRLFLRCVGLLRLCTDRGFFWRRRRGGGLFRSVGPGGFSFCRDRRFRMRCFSRTACCLFSLCLR
ncbi:Uncharacterised protein [Shigella sonnei]|nr:Uncharacterised protein [Shigella sonnei]